MKKHFIQIPSRITMPLSRIIAYFLFPLLLMVCTTNTTRAQTNKGDLIIGGQFHVSRQENNNDIDPQFAYKMVNFSVTPTLYYFIIPNLAIGVQTGLNHNRVIYPELTPGTNIVNQSFTLFNLGPVARYYFPLDEKWAVFADSRYNLSYNSQKRLDPVTNLFIPKDPKHEQRIFSGGLGLVHFISPNIGLEGLISYQNTKRFRDFNIYSIPATTTKIGLDLGIQFYLN
ncbi:hypothetical protein [Pararhodonellum marinum]|uniref:hypothetical protein n=1 Tax=Pararhodonellum marinum TaxID=2755358 RepID=UPI0018908D1C|nr:hypothetical protein [Pararhodonellum marinum]